MGGCLPPIIGLMLIYINLVEYNIDSILNASLNIAECHKCNHSVHVVGDSAAKYTNFTHFKLGIYFLEYSTQYQHAFYTILTSNIIR